MKFFVVTIFTVFISVTSCREGIKVAPHIPADQLKKYSQATFAAGCFWHEEAMFESVKGVQEAVCGYAGGSTINPTYESIETGRTGHAETVNVFYDSSVIDFPTLVKVYFAAQNVTQVDGQGPDYGSQYRSIAFSRNMDERRIIEEYIKAIQPKYEEPIAAEVMQLSKFWDAEDYHQNYIEHNPGSTYVQIVSIPEIKRLQKQYPQFIKEGYTY